MSRDEAAVKTQTDLAGPIDDLRTGVDECEAFLLDQLQQLDGLREMLARRESELAGREVQLAADAATCRERWQKLEQLRTAAEQGLTQVQQEAQRLAQTRTELLAMRENLERSQAETAPSKTGRGGKSGQNRRWEDERARLESALGTARDQVARLSGAALELADARQEVAELRKQLLKQQHRLAHAAGHFQTDQLQKLRLIEVERECLARELESAQRQLRELQQRAEREQRQSSGDRPPWMNELQKLREAVERQAALLADRAAGVSSGGVSFGQTEVTGAVTLQTLLGELEKMQSELNFEPTTPSQKSKS